MTGAIVYIDDEPALCRATRMVFDLMDIEVPFHTFTDPLAALEYIRTNDILLVFCDYRMPGLNALELLERIERELPFFVVSGDIDVTRWTDGNARVTGVLAKPYKPERLLEIVAAHLERDVRSG